MLCRTKEGDGTDVPNGTNEVSITAEGIPGEEVSDPDDVLESDELNDTFGEDAGLGILGVLVDGEVPPVVEKTGTASPVSNWNLSSRNSEFLLGSPRFVTTMV